MSKATPQRSCDALGVCQAHTTPCTGCQKATACPCPQACEVPAPDVDPLYDEPASHLELALFAAAVGAAIVAVGFLLKACSMA